MSDEDERFSPTNSSRTAGYLLPVGELPDDDAALEYQFQSAFAGLSGLDAKLVRRAFQGSDPKNPGNAVPLSPGPGINWLAFLVVSKTPLSVRAEVVESGPDTQQSRVLEQIEVRASFYGPQSGGYADRVRNSIRNAQNRTALRGVGLAYQETMPAVSLHDISGMTNQQTQRRFDLPMIFTRIPITTFMVENIVAVIGRIETEGSAPKGEAFAVQRKRV